MDMVTGVQILDEAVCISHNIYTLEKGMHPTIFSPAIDKYEGRLSYLTLVKQLILEKENSEFKPDKIH